MMGFSTGIAWAAAVVTAGIAAAVIYRDPRSTVHRIFALGMVLFAIEAGLTGFVYRAASLDDFLFWQRLRFAAASLLPAAWLMFSVSFARANHREQILKWKWILLAFLVLPLMLVALFDFHGDFLSVILAPMATSTLFMRVGWPGYAWHLLWIVCAILIIMNLERTFRHATGHLRWQTKFMFLGIGGIFGAHIFTDSQAVLFKGVDSDLMAVNLGALLVADLLIVRSLFRGKPLTVGIRLSHQFLYNSFTVLIAGLYFIAVGAVAWLSVRFQWIENIHISIFLVFLLIIGLAVILLSDRLRLKRKRFISRHLKRPQYDYQKIWETFTERTAPATRIGDLCHVVVNLVSDTLEILSVSIWLVDEKQESLSFGGSTVFTPAQVRDLKILEAGGAPLIRAMADQTMPVDLEGREDDWVADLRHTYELDTRESRIRYCMPLRAAGRLVGIMTLSEKVYYEPLSFEESELVRTIADQAAAGLLNLTLSEHLRQVRELEAFQTMSAFFMHDLKNLASKLSLVTQNLPVHMDNPEFRSDALRTIAQSVSRLNTMSSRLSLLSRKPEPVFTETDLNELVAAAVADAKEYVRAPVSLNPGPLPPVSVDPEQIHKVLENLLMNAYDALGIPGTVYLIQGSDEGAPAIKYTVPGTPGIQVATGVRDNWAEIAVRDSGCGMSKEFMEKQLFRPFQTTKKQGMGIGLYHCRTIVEAHGGLIQVDSEEGKGTTFRVLLPLTRPQGPGKRE